MRKLWAENQYNALMGRFGVAGLFIITRGYWTVAHRVQYCSSIVAKKNLNFFSIFFNQRN